MVLTKVYIYSYTFLTKVCVYSYRTDNGAYYINWGDRFNLFPMACLGDYFCSIAMAVLGGGTLARMLWLLAFFVCLFVFVLFVPEEHVFDIVLGKYDVDTPSDLHKKGIYLVSP